MMMRTALSALVVVFVAVLPGCGGGPSAMSGKVIRGDISFFVIVEANDPRLRGDGLAGAHITVNAVSGRGGALLAEGTSDSKGNVSLSVKDTAALLRPAEFTADLDGYTRTSSVMNLPPTDKRLLILLKPTAPGAAK